MAGWPTNNQSNKEEYVTKKELKEEIERLNRIINKLTEDVKFANVHMNGDLDSNTRSQHHTLGLGQNQASPGSHTHNGTDSNKVNMNGVSLYGAFLAGARYIDFDMSPYCLNPISTVIENPPLNFIRLLNGTTFTGSRNTDSWRQQIMTVMMKLGATNSTTG